MTNQSQHPTLGEVIDRALTKLGWSNAELARRTGLSTTHIGNLRRDISPGSKTGTFTRVPDATIQKLHDALGVPLDTLRLAAGLSAVTHETPPSLTEILNYLRDLPPARVKDIEVIVKSFHAQWLREQAVAPSTSDVKMARASKPPKS